MNVKCKRKKCHYLLYFCVNFICIVTKNKQAILSSRGIVSVLSVIVTGSIQFPYVVFLSRDTSGVIQIATQSDNSNVLSKG